MAPQALSTGVSIVLLFAILLVYGRIVRACVAKAFRSCIHCDQGRSRVIDECERIFVEALNIVIFVFMMSTRRNVERVLHSVFYWTIFTDVLFYKWGFQLRLSDDTATSSLWSHVWIDIWLSTADSSWSKEILIHQRYPFLVDIITSAANRFKGEITPFYMKLSGKNGRNKSSRSKSSKATAVLSRLTLAGCICAHIPYTSLAYNTGTSWRNTNSFAALKEDGTVQAWGYPSRGGSGVPGDLKDVRAIYSTYKAFAAVKKDGKVQAWGNSDYGGSGVPGELKDVRAIYSNNGAFAALKENGTVQAWGYPDYGGSVPGDLKDVRAIYSNRGAFAALKKDGKVQAWGISNYGGSGVPDDLKDVRAIYSTGYAFAALKKDGTVQAWGTSNYGGSGVPDDLKDVRAIYSTFYAFAALKEDGTVQGWGRSSTGGSGVPGDLKDVRAIYSTFYAFAALKEDGTVQAWGSPLNGGSDVPGDLKDVRAIYSTYKAFAALKEDGTVQAWGHSGYGGSGVPGDLKDVRAIYSTKYAFAALKEDGTVQAWGDSKYGGSGVPGDLKDVRSIYSTDRAFAALKGDGTVQAWGHSGYGGSGVPGDLKDVKMVFGFTLNYADSTSAHHYPCPHNTYGSGFPNCTSCPSDTNQPRGRPGIRSSIGSCIECNPGRYSTDGQFCSKSCLPSYLNVSSYNWFDGKELCLSCVLGKHVNVNISRSECTPCPAGRYRGSEGQVSCLECPTGQYAVEGSIRCSACEYGKTALPGKGFAKTDCFKVCPKGQYGTSNKCIPCKAGTYSNTKSGTNACTQCEAGKAQSLTNQKSCVTCERGKWVNVRGATECSFCPPGSYCPTEGMSDPKECPVGRYTDVKMQQNCSACPAGRYQNSTGSAKCLFCPKGTFLDSEGANSSALCKQCPPGKYGNNQGLATCSRCSIGQVQPNEGQVSCKDCSLEGKIKTNNAEHTLCVDNDELLQSYSMVEIIYSYGTAWVGSMLIASLFVAGAGIVTYYREKEPSRLASFSRLEAVYYSFLPGFSFGSWIFLVITVAAADTVLAVAMSFSRLLHLTGGIVVVLMLFGDERVGDRLGRVSAYMKRVRKQREHMDRAFARENVYLVEMMSLLSLCDITMFRFIPWTKSEFYKLSEGFPSMTIMNLCLVIKTVETTISVACDIAFLYLYGDSGGVASAQQQQTQALFMLNIIFGVGTIVMDLLVLCVRRGVLTELQDETSSAVGTTSEGSSGSRSRRNSAGPEVGEVYRSSPGYDGDIAGDFVPTTVNPLYTAAMEQLEQRERELEASKATIEVQRKEIEQLRQQQQQQQPPEISL